MIGMKYLSFDNAFNLLNFFKIHIWLLDKYCTSYTSLNFPANGIEIVHSILSRSEHSRDKDAL